MLQLASVLSILLLGGMVSESIGYYLCFLAVPFAIYWRRELTPEIRRQLRHLSLGLFLLWVIFPLSSLYNYTVSTEAIQIPFKLLMKSHFSSSLGISSLLFFLFTFKDIFHSKSDTRSPRLELQAPPTSSLMTRFLDGLILSSAILCVYILFQQIFGLDYRGHEIPEARRMLGGFFRVSAFYSHPLTLAGVGLTFFGFCGGLLIQKECDYKRSHILMLLATSAYFVFASGGRIASVLVVAFGLLIVLINSMRAKKSAVYGRSSHLLMKFIFLSGFIALCFFAVYKTGLLARFANLATMQDNNDFERLKFWQVHWRMFLDQPWFGQGFALVQAYKRDQYYELMGFATLQNKYPAHNMILEILSHVGLIGFLVICWGFTHIWQALQYAKQDQRLYINALLISFALNCLNGLTQNVFFDSSVMYIYLSLTMLIVWSELRAYFKESAQHPYRDRSFSTPNSSL